MKRLLSIFIAITAFVQISQAQHYDFSATVPSGQTLYFRYSTNGKVIVTPPNTNTYPYHYSGGPAGNLVIPGSIFYNGFNWEIDYIDDKAFYDCVRLTSVVISDSITSIGVQAFESCGGLASVVIGNGVTSIGGYAFYNCSGLTSTIYNGTIAQWCNISFGNGSSNPICYSLGLTIGDTVITNLVIPDSVTEIKPYAFYNCDSFRSLKIPDCVTNIGVSAFLGCNHLTNITLGSGLQTIGENAFRGCDHLTNITLGSGLQTIGENAFGGCTQVVRIKSYSTEAPTVQSNTFSDLSDNVIVNVPCGSGSIYENAAYWFRFDIQEDLMYSFSVTSGNPSQGTVQIIKQPTCDDAEAVVKANAYHNYHFVRWSDGNTDSLRYIVVIQDTAIQAEFAEGSGTEGIDNIEYDAIQIYSKDGRIFVVVDNHPHDEFRVFDVMGREVFCTTQGDETPQFPVGVYFVKLKGLPARKVVVIQ
ncbi:MAG: leucine-rich repeat domain-containing protein [Bacteroidales bacterium]|nr:leucine-rich repeat domain-containing protein [Bacteroidales bacterium]